MNAPEGTLEVRLHGHRVGTLTRLRTASLGFEYDSDAEQLMEKYEEEIESHK